MEVSVSFKTFFKKVHGLIKSRLYVLLVVLISILLTTYFLPLKPVNAEPNCDSPGPGDIDYCLQKIQQQIDTLKPANDYNKKELAGLKDQISSLEKKIKAVSDQLVVNQQNIQKREEDLAFAKEVFQEKTADYYKFIRLYDPVMPFLSAKDATSAFREIAFRQKATTENVNVMEKYAQDILKLNDDKANLEKNSKNLASVKTQVSKQANFLAGEVAKTDSYLASLSAKQQELVALKEGGFSTTVGDTPATLEPCSGKPGSSNFCDPGFRPAFAAFSYGAPHRKGMSQYGAYGRAKSGQSVDDILHAYYGGIEIRKDYPTNINITVSGYGTVDIETYVKRIYEMPASWTANDSAALKAQAVAARSYALAYTDDGARSICATESCQVYKPANKGGAWDAAVDSTRGWVLVANGKPFSAWYASTAGGYTFSYSANGYTTPDLWDTPSGQSGWPNSAYEVTGGSPWFYKGWYKSRSGASCGRGNPWLTSTEVADILNAWSVIYSGGGDSSRISPVDTNCWGGNPYSVSDLTNIGGFTSVSSVSIVYSSSGSTKSVTFGTNKGTVTINGDEFKKAFNLRAPGYIGLKSSLFNIEKL